MQYSLLIFMIAAAVLQFTSFSEDVYNTVCMLLILLVGIPHGAADHKIHGALVGAHRLRRFILQYVAMAIGYAIWWLLMPIKAALIFFLISIYHFGQEFLENNAIHRPAVLHIIIWGSALLLFPFCIANAEILESFQSLAEKPIWWPSQMIRTLFCVVIAIALIISLMVLQKRHRLSAQQLINMVLTIVCINLAYVFLPFLVAFTLYFILFHSFNAFSDQFQWLSQRMNNYNLSLFLRDLVLFSVIAISGLLLLYYLLKPLAWTEIILYSFVMISILTLPHTLLFDRMYKMR